jgi:hypothetical protein
MMRNSVFRVCCKSNPCVFYFILPTGRSRNHLPNLSRNGGCDGGGYAGGGYAGGYDDDAYAHNGNHSHILPHYHHKLLGNSFTTSDCNDSVAPFPTVPLFNTFSHALTTALLSEATRSIHIRRLNCN